MPTIDIPDTLAFTKLEALKALEVEVNRQQQQQVRRNIISTLRRALTELDEATDTEIGTVVDTLRETLRTQRQEFVRLGRVEADFRAQWTAAGGV